MGKIFASKLQTAFFPEEIYGPLSVSVPDDDWVRPSIDVDGQAQPDQTAVQPSKVIRSQVYPADAVEISLELYEACKSAPSIDWSGALPQPGQSAAPTPEQLWAAYQQGAKRALEGTSVTMERIVEAVALGLNSFVSPDVVAWMNFRRANRDIVHASSGDHTQPLPARPASYPAGT